MKKLLSIFACSLILSNSSFASGSHHAHDHKHEHKVHYKKFIVDTAHTTVGFSVRHMVISNVKGKFKQFEGKIKVNDQNVLHSFDLNMKAASIDTDNDNRDKHLRNSDFFDADKYPEIKFRSTKVIPLGGNEYKVIGDFTMKSTTKPVTLMLELNGPIKDPWGNTRLGASVKGKVNRKDFGLNFHKVMDAGGLLVGDEIKVEIELESIFKK
ncbi:MAG: polyisoprenoid-binding protein [Candidatus Cloacimonadota bacterium]|nr:MAG: polyisoprenoid-binding protein [Candidatus Cloacimonadota bacterium]